MQISIEKSTHEVVVVTIATLFEHVSDSYLVIESCSQWTQEAD